jgi:hypothetical protein
MNQPHLPRWLVILLFVVVTVTFFIGTSRTFIRAHAAFVLDEMAQKANPPSENGFTLISTATVDLPSLLPTPTPPPTSLLPPPTDAATLMPTPAPTPTPTPIPNSGYADTTGIIALAFLMVVVMLVGMVLGGRGPGKEKERK